MRALLAVALLGALGCPAAPPAAHDAPTGVPVRPASELPRHDDTVTVAGDTVLVRCYRYWEALSCVRIGGRP